MAERVFNFMRDNNISTMSEVREKYSETLAHYNSACENVNYYEQRIKALDENIRQGDIHLEHRELYAEYENLNPRKQPKFYEVHRADLTLFEAAQRYFKEHSIKPGFSLGDWKKERAELLAELSKAYREYRPLKTRLSEVETVRLAAEQIVRELNAPPQRAVRERG